MSFDARRRGTTARRARAPRRRPAGRRGRRHGHGAARRRARHGRMECRSPLTPQDDWPALFKKTAVEPVEQPQRAVPAAAAPRRCRGRRCSERRRSQVLELLAAARSRTCRWSRARRSPSWNDEGVTVHCGVQAPVPRAAGGGPGAGRARVAGPDHRRRLRRRVRRQAARRVRGGSGAAGAPGGRARARGVDARGGVHLQLHAPGRPARGGERRRRDRPPRGDALRQLQQRRGRTAAAVRHPAPLVRLLPRERGRAAGQLPVAGRRGQQLRARVAHGRMGGRAADRSRAVPPAPHHRRAAARGHRDRRPPASAGARRRAGTGAASA